MSLTAFAASAAAAAAAAAASAAAAAAWSKQNKRNAVGKENAMTRKHDRSFSTRETHQGHRHPNFDPRTKSTELVCRGGGGYDSSRTLNIYL